MSANRNDPCPCGSGRKYKKCCMEADAKRPPAPVGLIPGFSPESPYFSTDLDDLSNSVIGLIDSGELDAAEAVCRRLQAEYPDQVDGIWRLAMVCEARGDRAAAAKYYREAAAFMQTNEGFDEEGIADMLESAKLMEAGE